MRIPGAQKAAKHDRLRRDSFRETACLRPTAPDIDTQHHVSIGTT